MMMVCKHHRLRSGEGRVRRDGLQGVKKVGDRMNEFSTLVYRSPILDKERGWRRMLQVEQIYVAKCGCVFVVVVKILTKALGDVIIVKS